MATNEIVNAILTGVAKKKVYLQEAVPGVTEEELSTVPAGYTKKKGPKGSGTDTPVKPTITHYLSLMDADSIVEATIGAAGEAFKNGQSPDFAQTQTDMQSEISAVKTKYASKISGAKAKGILRWKKSASEVKAELEKKQADEIAKIVEKYRPAQELAANGTFAKVAPVLTGVRERLEQERAKIRSAYDALAVRSGQILGASAKEFTTFGAPNNMTGLTVEPLSSYGATNGQTQYAAAMNAATGLALSGRPELLAASATATAKYAKQLKKETSRGVALRASLNTVGSQLELYDKAIDRLDTAIKAYKEKDLSTLYTSPSAAPAVKKI